MQDILDEELADWTVLINSFWARAIHLERGTYQGRTGGLNHTTIPRAGNIAAPYPPIATAAEAPPAALTYPRNTHSC